MRKNLDQGTGRTYEALNYSSRFRELTKVFAGIVFFALLHGPVQAVQNVTLAWDPSPDPGVVGYNIQYGGASR